MFAGRDECPVRTSVETAVVKSLNHLDVEVMSRSDVDVSVVSVDQRTSVSRCTRCDCTRCDLFSRSDRRILVPRKDRLYPPLHLASRIQRLHLGVLGYPTVTTEIFSLEPSLSTCMKWYNDISLLS